MNETNQIPNDIRRRLEKMSLQELKAMHAKTLEMLEKWQLKPASPTLSLDKTKDNLNTFKPKDFFDHQKENERLEALGKRIEGYLEKEHGVTTSPFMEYKNGEFHFTEKDEGNVSFKIVEGKDDHFEIHIENEDYEDGWEPFTAFHKDELELEPAPEREQIEETHELNIEFR